MITVFVKKKLQLFFLLWDDLSKYETRLEDWLRVCPQPLPRQYCSFSFQMPQSHAATKAVLIFNHGLANMLLVKIPMRPAKSHSMTLKPTQFSIECKKETEC